MGILRVANVVRRDGSWGRGSNQDAPVSGLSSAVSDPCLPSSDQVLSGTPGTSTSGYIRALGVLVLSSETSTRCDPAELRTAMDAGVEFETDKAVAHTLWYGAGQSEIWLGHPDVATVATGTAPIDTLVALLEAFNARVAGTHPIVHMGLAAAFAVGEKVGALAGQYEMTLAVSPSYPSNGMAVTGPIDVALSPVQRLDQYAWSTNRVEHALTRMFEVGFDPGAAVIAGDRPAQTYSTTDGLDATFYSFGHDGPVTVIFGDGSANGTIAADAESVEHTYAGPGEYEASVDGRPVTVRVG